MQNAYREKVREDPGNQLIGTPEQFYKIRDIKEFEDIVASDLIDTVVDTREELLNWPLLKERLCSQVNKYSS